jgi:E3 Ubiquitin ligase
MQYVGYLLLVLSLVGIVIAILQMMKGKKIGSAPFHKTGEIRQNPQIGGATGLVSSEGQIQAQQPLMAPCSNKPCVYFHVKIEREVEKSTLTEDGTKTTKSWETVSEQKRGASFFIDDGSGPVGVMITDSVDANLEQTFSGTPPGGAGLMNLLGSALSGMHRHRAIEHIIPASGLLFVMGKMAGGQITKTDGMLGKLVASTKGRQGLLGATKRNMILGIVAAVLCLGAGVPLSILGDAPKSDACPSDISDALPAPCKGHIDSDEGTTWTWHVTKPGTYDLYVQQPNVKLPIWPKMTVTSASGDVVGTDTGVGKGADAHVSATFGSGTYKINVHDMQPGYAPQFKKGGGLSFTVNIKAGTAPAASASASAAAPVASTPPAAKIGGKPGATKPSLAKPH